MTETGEVWKHFIIIEHKMEVDRPVLLICLFVLCLYHFKYSSYTTAASYPNCDPVLTISEPVNIYFSTLASEERRFFVAFLQ